jgi:hypothetical protein
MNPSLQLSDYSQKVLKLRHRESITMLEKPSNTFYRFRINKDESRLFWIREASLDRKNWVIQNHFLSLKDVIFFIYKIKATNHLHSN